MTGRAMTGREWYGAPLRRDGEAPAVFVYSRRHAKCLEKAISRHARQRDYHLSRMIAQLVADGAW